MIAVLEDDWLPGDRPAEARARLARSRAEGRPFRFVFAERYHAPSIEARRLFRGGDVGTPIHFLAKVQAHPARLGGRAWLAEPALNRLPLAVWMQGPVARARVLESRMAGALAVVVLLEHAAPGRQSILEISVSPDLTHAGRPAIADKLECTGRDGFIRVSGIWGEASHAPRFELHRGAVEIVRRDLARDFASVLAAIEADAPRAAKQSKESYALAEMYLDACALCAAEAT